MAPHSMDLRTRVAKAWDATGDADAVAPETNDVSAPAPRQWQTWPLRHVPQYRLTALAVFNGPIDNPTSLAYVEQVLVPTLRAGDVVALDISPFTDNRRCARRSPPSALSSAFCRLHPDSIRSNWPSRS